MTAEQWQRLSRMFVKKQQVESQHWNFCEAAKPQACTLKKEKEEQQSSALCCCCQFPSLMLQHARRESAPVLVVGQTARGSDASAFSRRRKENRSSERRRDWPNQLARFSLALCRNLLPVWILICCHSVTVSPALAFALA